MSGWSSGPALAAEVPPGAPQPGAAGAAEGLTSALPITVPPDSVFERFKEGDLDVARKFYTKYADVNGLAVMASADVADEALRRTHLTIASTSMARGWWR